MYARAFFAAAILFSGDLLAQSNDNEITTRSEQIQAERLEKDATIPPTPAPATQSRFGEITHVIRRMPVDIESRGLGTGHGITLVSELEWQRPQYKFLSRVWGNGQLHGFYSAGVGLDTSNYLSPDVRLALEASHSDAPQLDYYGPGPNSSIHNQTDYRREDTLFDLRGQFARQSHFRGECGIGELLINVGPGTSDALPSTESVFGRAQAPGIDVQSNFFIAGCSAELDFRDYPEDPHRGAFAAVRYDRYNAQADNRFSFNRLSAVGEQYFPFWNQKRVVALLAQTNFSFHSGNQVVPFYLQPTLGSDTQLRGFRRYRFYDENSIALTAEYRWEIAAGLDMAVFGDWGQVFHRPRKISLLDLENSGGFGLRFKDRSSVIARLDFGFSREGFQLWLKFVRLSSF